MTYYFYKGYIYIYAIYGYIHVNSSFHDNDL